jgi:hypothetical protein
MLKLYLKPPHPNPLPEGEEGGLVYSTTVLPTTARARHPS